MTSPDPRPLSAPTASMRRLAILGGSGRTGRLLIDRALAAGYDLRVLARDADRLHRRDPRLTVVGGDARTPEDLAALLQGTDAVLSALGPVSRDAVGVMTLAAQGLAQVMPAAGITRLVTLTGAGVAQPGDRPKLLDHLIRRVLKLAQPDVLRDSTGHVETLRSSSLDWTVVRAPMLTDGPAAPLRVGMVGDIGPRLSRASAAAFMLEQLGSDSYSRQAPAISN